MIKGYADEYDKFYESNRYQLVWNLCMAFSILLAIVSAVNYSNPNYSATPNLIGIAYGVTSLGILKYKGDFVLVSKIISISSFIVISSTFFLLKNAIHYTTPMWMLLNVLFTFFTLRIYWGLTMIILHFLVLTIYIFTLHDYNIHHIHAFGWKDLTNYAIEFLIIGFGIGYILIQYVKTHLYAEKQLRLVNKNLLTQNKIIGQQNKEMEVMLKEIHHRVKNNLQVIISLLRLQSYKQQDDPHKGFEESINRVKSMALIHEQMYQSAFLSDFDLKEYLETFLLNLIDSYAIQKKIKYDINVNFIGLKHKNIVPLALLFNELVSNTLKHAFDDQKEPEITINIVKVTDVEFILNYYDNGKWKEVTSTSFGMELIDAMTDQLGGTLEIIKNEQGTEFHFRLLNE